MGYSYEYEYEYEYGETRALKLEDVGVSKSRYVLLYREHVV